MMGSFALIFMSTNRDGDAKIHLLRKTKMTPIGKTTFWKTVALTLGFGAMSVAATSVSCQAKSARRAAKSGDILFSARFYLKPGTQRGSSYFHIYRINADGTGKRQITFGKHNDETALWTHDGRKIVFIRDNQKLILADENGKNQTELMSKSEDKYWGDLRASPDGKSLNYLDSVKVGANEVERLNFLDLKTRKIERINNVSRYAWSPDAKKLLMNDEKLGLRVLDLSSRQIVKSKAAVTTFAWISPTRWIGTTATKSKDGGMDGISGFLLGNSKGETLKKFALAPDKYGQFLDWRSYVAPIPNDAQNFLFVLDESTSSGYEAFYYRVSAATGKMTRLSDGQFFAWAPNGKRYLNVTYRDTPSYDTLPNGHQRSVYTSKLQVGSSEKTLRDIVSGFVLIFTCDWRTPR